MTEDEKESALKKLEDLNPAINFKAFTAEEMDSMYTRVVIEDRKSLRIAWLFTGINVAIVCCGVVMMIVALSKM